MLQLANELKPFLHFISFYARFYFQQLKRPMHFLLYNDMCYLTWLNQEQILPVSETYYSVQQKIQFQLRTFIHICLGSQLELIANPSSLFSLTRKPPDRGVMGRLNIHRRSVTHGPSDREPDYQPFPVPRVRIPLRWPVTRVRTWQQWQ